MRDSSGKPGKLILYQFEDLKRIARPSSGHAQIIIMIC